MLLSFLLALVNWAVAKVGRKFVKLPGFDLTPFFIILLARVGENIWLAALLLTLSFSYKSIKKIRYLWLTVPATVLLGFLAPSVHSFILLLLAYHLVCFVFALLLGFFGFRYFLFMMTNMALNLVAIRLYTLFF